MTNDDIRFEQLRNYLADLGQQLAELDTRLGADDARSILIQAFRSYNDLAGVIAPDLAVPEEDDLEVLAEEMKPWIDEDEHDGE